MKRTVKALAIASLLVVGCTKEDRLVKVSQESIEKSVMITVRYSDSGDIRKVGGAGVFVTPDGYILTCKHLFTVSEIVEGIVMLKDIEIEMFNDKVVTARLVCLSRKSDLALLKTDVSSVSYTLLADPRKLKIGQEVLAVGCPLGLAFTVTYGVISQLYRDIAGSYNVTQSDVSINPGNSGGPLFNLKGELVGINSFILTPVPGLPIFTGLGFSVQSGQCLEFLVWSKNKISPYKKYRWLQVLNRLKDSGNEKNKKIYN